MRRTLAIAAGIAVTLPIWSVARAQTPTMLLHQFVERPLGDYEKKVLEVSKGCMAMAEAPDDDWDRLLDLIEHNKNEYAYDLGFKLLDCRELPDRTDDLRAALAGMLENDPGAFMRNLAKHALKPGELSILLASLRRDSKTEVATTLQRRLDRARSVYEPDLMNQREQVIGELKRLIAALPQRSGSSLGEPPQQPTSP